MSGIFAVLTTLGLLAPAHAGEIDVKRWPKWAT